MRYRLAKIFFWVCFVGFFFNAGLYTWALHAAPGSANTFWCNIIAFAIGAVANALVIWRKP